MPKINPITENEIVSHMERLSVRVARYTRFLKDAQDRHDALALALDTIKGPSVAKTSTGSRISIEEVAGKSVQEVLLLIARKHGGELKVSPARRLLVEAELLADGQIGSNRLNAIIYKMSEFEHVGRGLYRLENEKSDKFPLDHDERTIIH